MSRRASCGCSMETIMQLTDQGLKNKDEWHSKGYKMADFDREAVRRKTKEAPFWIHFGAGNLFKAFHANALQNMLNRKEIDRGLVVAEGFDYGIIDKSNRPHDDLNILVTLKSNGEVEKTVVSSVVESLKLDSDDQEEFDRLKEIFRNPSLQMATFTITEKGYGLKGPDGAILPAIAADLEAGPEKPGSYLGKVAALLYERYKNGELPIAMVSTDNCSHNGDKLRDAIVTYAEGWAKNGRADEGFVSYVENPEKVSFPLTMIDKITPRPDPSVEKILAEDGLEDLQPVKTDKGSFVAPFVNAEETQYLVIEDKFPNGRPKLEDGGFIFTDRETVEKVETMKVTTCLNPLHTALAVFGCLLDFKLIADEMKDQDLVDLIKGIGYDEALKVVVDPGVLNPKEFIDTVVNVRFPNPFMPDTPQRIATDTSQKLAIRYGETVKKYMEGKDLDVDDLNLIPLVYAGWLRYLMGVDDEGKPFEPSADPLLASSQEYVKDIKLGQPEGAAEKVMPLLKNKDIFGLDLTTTPLADKTCGYFEEMLAGPGAVRATIHKYASKA